MSFEIKREENHSTIISKVEKLNSLVAPELKSQLVLLDKEGVSNYIIDLSSTRYCDSSGLSALLVANRLAKGANGCLVICGLQDSVNKMLEISQLHTVLNITQTQKEAVEFVMTSQVENEMGNDDK